MKIKFLLILIISGSFLSCASHRNMDQSILGASPQEAIESARYLVNLGEIEQADLISKDDFNDSKEYLKKAENCFFVGNWDCSKENAAISASHSKAALTRIQNLRSNAKAYDSWKSALLARKSFRDQELTNSDYVLKKLRKVDENFYETTHRFSDDVSQSESNYFVDEYINLSTEAIVYNNLENSYDLIERSRKMEAAEFAPELYEAAQNSYTSAVSKIKANPYNRQAYDMDVKIARYNAKMLKDVMDVMYEGDEPVAERTAVAIVFQKRNQAIAEQNKEKEDQARDSGTSEEALAE